MIISSRYQFMFFAVPKTGTHSIRQALRPHLAADDMEQVGLFVRKQLPWPALAELGHGHISALQARPVVGEDHFNRYFKFAFVRNPYDRFVSYCAFMARNNHRFELEPRAFMRHLIRDRPPHEHLLFRPQHELLCDADGRLLMDFIGRVEHMQRDYDVICSRLGLPSTTLPRINASDHRPYSDYYDDELRELVAVMYARDIELFRYGFHNEPSTDPTPSDTQTA